MIIFVSQNHLFCGVFSEGVVTARYTRTLPTLQYNMINVGSKGTYIIYNYGFSINSFFDVSTHQPIYFR